MQICRPKTENHAKKLGGRINFCVSMGFFRAESMGDLRSEGLDAGICCREIQAAEKIFTRPGLRQSLPYKIFTACLSGVPSSFVGSSPTNWTY